MITLQEIEDHLKRFEQSSSADDHKKSTELLKIITQAYIERCNDFVLHTGGINDPNYDTWLQEAEKFLTQEAEKLLTQEARVTSALEAIENGPFDESIRVEMFEYLKEICKRVSFNDLKALMITTDTDARAWIPPGQQMSMLGKLHLFAHKVADDINGK